VLVQGVRFDGDAPVAGNAVLVGAGGHGESDHAVLSDLDEVAVPDPAVVLPGDLLVLPGGDFRFDLRLCHGRVDCDRLEYVGVFAHGPSSR
jgi:hypothetical protein